MVTHTWDLVMTRCDEEIVTNLWIPLTPFIRCIHFRSLSSILNIHAPSKIKTVITTDASDWYSEQNSNLKRVRSSRRIERRGEGLNVSRIVKSIDKLLHRKNYIPYPYCDLPTELANRFVDFRWNCKQGVNLWRYGKYKYMWFTDRGHSFSLRGLGRWITYFFFSTVFSFLDDRGKSVWEQSTRATSHCHSLVKFRLSRKRA